MRKKHRQTSTRNRTVSSRKASGATTSTGGSGTTTDSAGAATSRTAREVPPPAERKPRFQEAVAVYEAAVRQLQRHEFVAAADQFRAVIAGYPEERELLERARLYLRVCERETSRQPPAIPRTPDERVYAATMALNAGELQAALAYLHQALTEDPDHDHGHYIMSVALLDAGDTSGALEHLQQSIRLNPDNLSLARQDPDLEGLRSLAEFGTLNSLSSRRPGAEAERKVRRR